MTFCIASVAFFLEERDDDVSDDKLVFVLDGDWRFMLRGRFNDEYAGAVFRWPSEACLALSFTAMGMLAEDCPPNNGFLVVVLLVLTDRHKSLAA
jgi:hypothetical protein